MVPRNTPDCSPPPSQVSVKLQELRVQCEEENSQGLQLGAGRFLDLTGP